MAWLLLMLKALPRSYLQLQSKCQVCDIGTNLTCAIHYWLTTDRDKFSYKGKVGPFLMSILLYLLFMLEKGLISLKRFGSGSFSTS